MPARKVSMRRIREVLRLRFGLGLHQDQIARSCSIGQATVHRYLAKAAAAGLSWPLAEDCDDRRLNELLFPARPQEPYAVTLHVRIRAGGGQQWPSLPRPYLSQCSVSASAFRISAGNRLRLRQLCGAPGALWFLNQGLRTYSWRGTSPGGIEWG